MFDTPPREFNFAQHLLSTQAPRADKTALIDDVGRLTYGTLGDQVRRCAALLQSLGLRREERVLLVMHDSSDWVVSFLGALYAGIVPVAVNTLLTADDYSYMLADSRARAVLTSGPLVPVIQQALGQSNHEVQCVLVSRAASPQPGTLDFNTRLAQTAPAAAPAPTLGDEPAFWLYSSGSTGKPKGTVHTQASLWWTDKLYGQAVLGLTERDTVFSAAKLFFAYG